jgi:AmmeMemoRadiSam system protein B
MASPVRDPVVAGSFYPGTETALRRTLDSLFDHPVDPNPAPLPGPVGLVMPHAGYVYSGRTAAQAIEWVAARGTPEWVVLLGTNHTGWGSPVSVDTSDAWRTPLGLMPVADAARQVVGAPVDDDPRAFLREHSLEVALPLVQYAYGTVPFVPVCIGTRDVGVLERTADRLCAVIGTAPVAIVASSDFTHYEPHDAASAKDREAIGRILALDARGFLQMVSKQRLSICGAGAIATLMLIGTALGWSPGHVLAYSTSGEVTGERDAVVGYAALAWERQGG